MWRELFLLGCVTLSVAWAWGQTERRWPPRRDPLWPAWSGLLAGAAAAVMAAFPAPLPGGPSLDLAAWPVALVTLRFGGLAGLVALVPVLAVHPRPDLALTLALAVAFTEAGRRITLRRRALPPQTEPFALSPATWAWTPVALAIAATVGAFVPPREVFPPERAPALLALFLALGGLAYTVIASRFDALRLAQGERSGLSLDPLTGVADRRQFDLDGARRDHSHLLLLGLDHLNVVTEAYGDVARDTVLRETARALRAGLRGEDRVYHLGSAEFAVLLRGCPPAVATHVTERLRDRVRHDLRVALPGLILPVTVSAGLVNLAQVTDFAEGQRRASELLGLSRERAADLNGSAAY